MDTLVDYFPADISKLVDAAAHIKPIFGYVFGNLVMISNAGEVVHNDLTLISDLRDITNIDTSIAEIIVCLRIDAKVVYMDPIAKRLLPVEQLNNLDCVEILPSYIYQRLVILTNTGQVYSVKLTAGAKISDLQHHKHVIDIVQLRADLALDSQGRIQNIYHDDIQIKDRGFVTNILPGGQLMTLDGLYSFDVKKSWYSDRKYNLIKKEQKADSPLFFLDKKGIIFTSPDEIIPDVTNISDIVLHTKDDKPYLVSIDANNKLQSITWVMKPVFSVADGLNQFEKESIDYNNEGDEDEDDEDEDDEDEEGDED